MSNRLTDAILLLYPRRVREGHGAEIVALMDDLVAYEGRSRAALSVRLAADGLVQRIGSTAMVWTVAAVLAATTFGDLALSDFAAASALQGGSPTAPAVPPQAVHAVASRAPQAVAPPIARPAARAPIHRTPHSRPRSRRA
jgi:hypothetical protein